MVCLVYKNIFLLKFCRWKVLAEREKHFCSQTFFVIKYFRFSFFLFKNGKSSLKKVTSSLSQQPPSKNGDSVKPHFRKFGGRFTSAEWGQMGDGGSTLWFSGYINYCYKIIKNNYIEAPKCSVYCMPTLHISMEDFERYLNMCF